MSWSAPSEVPTSADRAEGHDDPFVVAFTAPWCSHCRAMLPDLLEAAAQPGAPRLEVVDVSSAPEAASAHGVAGTPTIIGFVGGAEVDRLVGRKGPTRIHVFFDAVATQRRHRPSIVDPVVRFGGGALIGVLGLATDAVPLLVFAAIVVLASARSEWKARRG